MQFRIIDASEIGWIVHDGVSKLDGAPGRGSGRWPLGSGKRPFRHQVEGTTTRQKKKTLNDAKEELSKKQISTLKDRLEDDQKISLTDDELRSASERNRLEKEYIESQTNLLNAQSAYNNLTQQPSKISKGKNMVERILTKSVEDIGQQLSTYAIGAFVNKMFGYPVVNPKKGQGGGWEDYDRHFKAKKEDDDKRNGQKKMKDAKSMTAKTESNKEEQMYYESLLASEKAKKAWGEYQKTKMKDAKSMTAKTESNKEEQMYYESLLASEKAKKAWDEYQKKKEEEEEG